MSADEGDSTDDEPAGLTDDVLTTVYGIQILEATRDRPVRPNLPWARNLSHTKLHAALLGISLGIFVTFVYVWGDTGAVVGIGIALFNFILSDRQKKSKKSTCEHRMGAHDIRKKPWYFVPPLILTIGVTYYALTLL